MIRDLLSSMGFTLATFFAVVVVFLYAVFLGASEELVMSMLCLGVLTAIAEYVMRKEESRRP